MRSAPSRLRQNAIARTGAAVAAMIGPEAETPMTPRIERKMVTRQP